MVRQTEMRRQVRWRLIGIIFVVAMSICGAAYALVVRTFQDHDARISGNTTRSTRNEVNVENQEKALGRIEQGQQEMQKLLLERLPPPAPK